MSRFTSIRRLLGVGVVATAVIVACRTSEAPPLAPRPEPMPVSGAPDRILAPRAPTADGGILPALRGASTVMSFAAPKPGGYAIAPDAGALADSALAQPPVAPAADAAIGDAVNLPPVPDAYMLRDANRFPAANVP